MMTSDPVVCMPCTSSPSRRGFQTSMFGGRTAWHIQSQLVFFPKSVGVLHFLMTNSLSFAVRLCGCPGGAFSACHAAILGWLLLGVCHPWLLTIQGEPGEHRLPTLWLDESLGDLSQCRDPVFSGFVTFVFHSKKPWSLCRRWPTKQSRVAWWHLGFNLLEVPMHHAAFGRFKDWGMRCRWNQKMFSSQMGRRDSFQAMSQALFSCAHLLIQCGFQHLERFLCDFEVPAVSGWGVAKRIRQKQSIAGDFGGFEVIVISCSQNIFVSTKDCYIVKSCVPPVLFPFLVLLLLVLLFVVVVVGVVFIVVVLASVWGWCLPWLCRLFCLWLSTCLLVNNPYRPLLVIILSLVISGYCPIIDGDYPHHSLL